MTMPRAPKYSIVIPAYNGLTYLTTCLSTVLEQDYLDYEVIVSDDHSRDGTQEYFAKFSHPRLRFLSPERSMSMAEHWEWALDHARGTWLMFVGQDDGLQPYFFSLADRLTALAEKKQINSIMSERALFFWQGCEKTYGPVAVAYSARPIVQILNSKFRSVLALLGKSQYFDLPEMYTTSLFHRDLLNKARLLQGGKVFRTHPQDANLAAIACSLEKRYLHSSIPLGWVGSSPKSAGLAVTSAVSEDQKELKSDYVRKTLQSPLKCNPRIGSFEVGSLGLYYWGALLESGSLQSTGWRKLMHSRFLAKVVLSAVAAHEITLSDQDSHQTQLFRQVLSINQISEPELLMFQKSVMPGILLVAELILMFHRLWRKVLTTLRPKTVGEELQYQRNWNDYPQTTMLGMGERILQDLAKTKTLRDFIGRPNNHGMAGPQNNG